MPDRLKRRMIQALYKRRTQGTFRRPFDGAASRRLLLLAVDHSIPQSQLFPFHYHAKAFRDRLDVGIRQLPVDGHLDVSLLKRSTTICFQTSFDISDEALTTLISTIRTHNPDAQLVYLHWFAPTDLRLAARIGPLVDAYVSKHLLRDRRQYGEPTYGDTTLMEYYGRSFDLQHDVMEFSIPKGFMEKLYLGPSFATADFMLPAFDHDSIPVSPRAIDLHARIAKQGTPWYHAMRQASADAVNALEGVRCATGFGIRHGLFLRELRNSKICFSPFGYGEVCWRDYEAILCGAVLLKQDMSHVATEPDIFRPSETYVPVKWDLSDFEEQVRWLLSDASARQRIARNAYEVLQDYARTARFTQQMTPALFPDAAQ